MRGVYIGSGKKQTFVGHLVWLSSVSVSPLLPSERCSEKRDRANTERCERASIYDQSRVRNKLQRVSEAYSYHSGAICPSTYCRCSHFWKLVHKKKKETDLLEIKVLIIPQRSKRFWIYWPFCFFFFLTTYIFAFLICYSSLCEVERVTSANFGHFLFSSLGENFFLLDWKSFISSN